MEPVGPWFSTYTRISNQQSSHPGSDLHSSGPPPTSSQLFLGTPHHPGTSSPFQSGPSGFLSPQPVTYDPVFNPLFHQKTPYRTFKQQSEVETYNYIPSSGSNYFEHSNSTPLAWTQNNQLHSPFGVLPHESFIQSTSVVKPFENLGHFTPQTINHFNAQNDYKNLDYDNRKFTSPMKPNAPIFCQTVNDYQRFQNHLPQGFSSVQDPGSRYQQPSFRGNQFLQKNDSSCECAPRYARPLVHSDPKVSGSAQIQSSPISYAMFDNERNYQGSKLEPQSIHLNHLNYNRFSSPEDCIQRSRGLKGLVETYGSRPSPVTSPAYPLYYHNSPVTASSSNSSPSPVDPSQPPQDDPPPQLYQQTIRPTVPAGKPLDNPPVPLDVTLTFPRPMTYASMIPRSALNKNLSVARGEEESWETREKRSFPNCAEVQTPLHLQSLKSCRGDPMSLVKTLQQQNQQAPMRNANFESDKKCSSGDFFNRVPPPAHHNTFTQQVQNGYFDFERWNSAKVFSTPSSFAAAQNNHSGKFSISTPHVQPQPAYHVPVPTYINPLSASSSIPETVTMADEVVNDSLDHQNPDSDPSPVMEHTAESSSNHQTESTRAANSSTGQNMPSIEEELGFIQCDAEPTQTTKNLVQTNTNVGFMNEFIKFLQSTGSDQEMQSKATKHPLENESASNECVKILKPAVSDGKPHPKGSVVEESLANYINFGQSEAIRSGQNHEQPRVPTDKSNSEVSVSTNSNCVNQVDEKFPYAVGEFVVVKSDLHVLHPPIWKVKKNLLLQKFTHFVSRGVTFYSNVPVFTGWSPGTKKVYEKVQIRIIKLKKEDMIVKLISTNMLALPSESSLMVKLIEENKKYREDFEIYVQALFSQALDSTFLKEIHQEKDDYFLKRIRTVEEFWLEVVIHLKEVLTWSKDDIEKLSSSPNYRYVRGVWTQGNCVCSKPATTQVALGGLPYAMATLELLKTPVPQQSVSLCDSCSDSFELLHKLTHQKHALFSLCDDIVAAKKVECLNNDASIILNDLLQDDDWFNKTFSEFLKLWGYAGKITRDLARLKKINDDGSST